MAEEKKAEPAKEPAKAAKGKPSALLIIMLVLNSVAIFGMGFLLYSFMQQKNEEPSLEPLVEAAKEEAEGNTEEPGLYEVAFDHFYVNLSGDAGQRLFKVTMSFDVDSSEVQEEINKRMPQVRDIIIILLSSRSYSQVSTPKGKEKLKEEIRDTVNSILTKGKINKVLFTEFLYS